MSKETKARAMGRWDKIPHIQRAMTHKRSREVHFWRQRSRSQNRSLLRGWRGGGEQNLGEVHSTLPVLFWRVSFAALRLGEPGELG